MEEWFGKDWEVLFLILSVIGVLSYFTIAKDIEKFLRDTFGV